MANWIIMRVCEVKFDICKSFNYIDGNYDSGHRMVAIQGGLVIEDPI